MLNTSNRIAHGEFIELSEEDKVRDIQNELIGLMEYFKSR